MGSVEMTSSETPVRLNVNGHRLPIRVESEPETVHVHAHGLTLVSFAALRVISTEHTDDCRFGDYTALVSSLNEFFWGS